MTEFNTPSHYVLADGSDSMDALAKILGPEEFKGFLRGNAIKYLIRYKQKGGVEDLKKAMDYINRLLAVEEVEEKEREFIKKSRPLLYKDEAEEEETESSHSHDIKIPAHCYVKKKDDSTKKAKKYTKKPLAIEAIKYDKKNIGRLQNFCDKLRYNPHDNEYYIERSNGCKKVVDGDFVIKGINGEFYPCKADFFEKTYEPMTSEELSKTE